MTGIVAAAAVGAVDGYIATDREMTSRPAGWKIGKAELRVGDFAGVAGAAALLGSGSESTRRLGSYTAAAGAALRGQSVGRNYRLDRDKK